MWGDFGPAVEAACPLPPPAAAAAAPGAWRVSGGTVQGRAVTLQGKAGDWVTAISAAPLVHTVKLKVGAWGDNMRVGVCTPDVALQGEDLFGNAKAVALHYGGGTSHNLAGTPGLNGGYYDSHGVAVARGDVVTLVLDRPAQRLHISVNGRAAGVPACGAALARPNLHYFFQTWDGDGQCEVVD